MNLIEIKNDLFDVSERLKSVDESYRLFFNVDTQRYEVYENNHGFTRAFVVPYDELDARTISYARFTRVENSKALFEEIEENNAAVDRQLAEQCVDQIANLVEV